MEFPEVLPITTNLTCRLLATRSIAFLGSELIINSTTRSFPCKSFLSRSSFGKLLLLLPLPVLQALQDVTFERIIKASKVPSEIDTHLLITFFNIFMLFKSMSGFI